MPATFYPKKRFQISGENVNFIPEISFGGDPVENLVYDGTTGISGVVPPGAVTADLLINNGLGLAPYGVLQVVLDSESQVVGGYLEDDTVSGKAGELINITGENFYHITDVKFGETESTFTVDSDTEINVIVPTNAGYGGITVFSSERTGLAGSITEASGISPNSFVPIANVTGLSSGTLSSGETLTIQGESLSAVTGVSFPRMESHPAAISVSDVTSTSLNLIIPSGRVQGAPTMHMRSGISTEALSTISFSQAAQIKSNINYTGHTGANLNVYGWDFTTGTLHPIGEIPGSSPSRSGYLVRIGEETGMFDLDPAYVSNVFVGLQRLSGVIPSGIPVEVNSGVVGVGTNISSLIKRIPISIYSDNYPTTYQSTGSFRPVPDSPTILSVTPSSGISGDAVVIEGTDLYNITGVLFTGYPSAGNVGLGQNLPILEVSHVSSLGNQIEVSVPDDVEVSIPETNYGIIASGAFGEASFGLVSDIPTGFVALGKPKINEGYPQPDGVGVEELVLPNSTGIIEGSGIYSGTSVLLYKGSVANEANLLGELPSSGYSTTGGNNVVEFTYPNAFDFLPPDFKIRLKNDRSYSLNSKTIQAFRRPIISGFTPLSGVYGDNITLTGYFGTPGTGAGEVEGPIVPSGVSVGQVKVSEGDFNLLSENLIIFKIPDNAASNIVNVVTSGGSSSSNQVLTVFPPKPYISGYYPGEGDKPYITGVGNTGFAEDQVFGKGNLMTITGSRMNLLTGVLFSGTDGTIGVNSFVQKSNSKAVVHIPTNINPESGHFILKDFENRSNDNAVSSVYANKFPVPLNIATVSGLSGLLLPDPTTQSTLQRFGLSGQNISGLVPSFPTPTGDLTNLETQGFSNPVTYYVDSNGVETLTAKVPRGITNGSVRLSGLGNSFVLDTSESFLPLAAASTITPGLPNLTLATGTNMLITGYNSYNSTAQSGSRLVGITGTGNKDNTAQVYFYPINTYSSGLMGSTSICKDSITFQLDSGFIGTGRFFIVNPWEDFGDIESEFPDSLSASGDTLNNQIASYPFEYVLQGTRVDVTGYTPARGVTGDNVTISGEGFTPVTGVFFKIPNGPLLEADFTLNSDTQITATIPPEGIEARGMTDIIISGGTNDTVADFEVLLDASTVKFNILSEGDVPVDITRTSQFSIEETHDGVIYIVTKTRYPDGTTAITSSVPKL